MGHEVRYTRITNYTRLTDRYLTIQVKKPSDTEKNSLGIIFALVEITSPWFPNSQIGQSIINTLTQEYYKTSEKEPLENFENALKKVNISLSRFAQEGENNWIGNINAIFLVVIDNDLLFANTGKAEGFLIRKDKISKIIEGYSPDSEPHPLKTFTNIVSGNLSDGDKIIITSPVLLDYISQKEIKDIISPNSPFNASVEISDFLKNEHARHVNSVILELLSKDKVENLPINKEEVVYLDQASSVGQIASSTKKYAASILPFLENIKKDFLLGLDKTKHFINKEIKPRTKNTWEKTKEISQKGYSHLATKTAPQIRDSIKPISDQIGKSIKNSMNMIPQKAEIKEKDDTEIEQPYSVHYYDEINGKSKLDYFYKLLITKTKLFFGRTIKVLSTFWHWLTKKNNRPILYASIIAILIIVLIFSVIVLRKKQSNKKLEASQTELINNLNSKYSEAKLAILYNTPEKAKTLLNDTIKQALLILNTNPTLANEAKDIINKSNTEFDKLTATTRFENPKLVANFTESLAIFEINNKLIALNNKNNKLYYTNNSTTPIEAQGPNQDLGIYKAFGFDTENSIIYSLTNKNNLFAISDANQTPSVVAISGGTWENADQISPFNGNLYLLDKTLGQIFKHTKTNEAYNQGVEFINSSDINIKNAASMTIDGSIYILKSDGSVIKLSKGKIQDFTVKDIPTPNDKIVKPKKIWSSAETNFIYILDDNRIIELDKTGKFIKQYAFSTSIKNISDFYIDSKNNNLWILDDNKAYSTEFQS